MKKRILTSIFSIILVFSMMVCMVIPSNALKGKEQHYDIPYQLYRARNYKELFEKEFMSEANSYANLYFTAMDQDGDVKNAITLWRSAHLLVNPNQAVTDEHICREKDLYLLALFDMLDMLGESKGVYESVTNDYLDISADIVECFLKEDVKLTIGNLKSTLSVKDEFSNLYFVFDSLMEGVADFNEAIERCARYMAMSNYNDYIKEILYAISDDYQNALTLRDAAEELADSFDNMEAEELANKAIAATTAWNIVETIMNYAWSLVKGRFWPVLLVSSAAEAIDVIFRRSEIERSYHLLKATVELENALRRIAYKCNENFNDTQNEYWANYYMQIVELYENVVIDGFDRSVELLETQLSNPSYYISSLFGGMTYSEAQKVCTETIAEIKNYKADKIERYKEFEKLTLEIYEATYGPAQVYNISASSSEDVMAYLYKNDDKTGYELIISGFGKMRNWNDYSQAPWSEYASQITHITIENGIENIGDFALADLDSVQTITLPASVTTIGDYALADCDALTKVISWNGVTSLGEYAFYDCDRLKSIEFTSIMVSVGDYAFAECDSLTSAVIKGKMDYVAEGLFANCINLSSLNLKEDITTIDKRAFYNCKKLRVVTLPSNLKIIYDNAFEGCESLYGIVFNDILEFIEPYAFCGTGLEVIVLPRAVISIGEYAFSQCAKLRIFEFENDSTEIGQKAFSYCTSLNDITLPDALPGIANSMFIGCSALKNIKIPGTVSAIGNSAFANCVNLLTIEIPKGVISIGNDTFSGCTALEEILIHQGLKTVGNNAFSGCSSLESIEIPYGVTKLGSGAFKDCKKISTVNLPNSITSLGSMAFCGCLSLTDVTIPSSISVINESTFYDCKALSYIEIPNSVTSIGSYCFTNCYSLVDVVVSVNIKSLGDGIFGGCYSLANFDIPNGVTSIGVRAFADCSSLTGLDIPIGVTRIGKGAFSNCKSFTEFTFPNGITTIEERVLQGCDALIRVNLPNSIITIGKGAFFGCKSLENITLPDSLTGIGDYAFYNCESLEILLIPRGVKTVGRAAFAISQGVIGIDDIESAVATETILSDPITLFDGKTLGAERWYDTNWNGWTASMGQSATIVFKEEFEIVLGTLYLWTSWGQGVTLNFYNADGELTYSVAAGAYLSEMNGNAVDVAWADEAIKVKSLVIEVGNNKWEGYGFCMSELVLGKYERASEIEIYTEIMSETDEWSSVWNDTISPVKWDYKETVREQIFIFKGYSFNEHGSMAIGFDIDYDSKEIYESLTGEILEIGVVFAGYDLLLGNQPLDELGNELILENGRVIKFDLSDCDYTYYDFVITDITEEYADISLVISAYINNGYENRYVQDSGMNDTVFGISYNSAKSEIEEEI